MTERIEEAREKAATARIEELRKRHVVCPACGVAMVTQQRTRCPECRGPFVWPAHTEEDAAFLLAQLRGRDEKLAAVEELGEAAEGRVRELDVAIRGHAEKCHQRGYPCSDLERALSAAQAQQEEDSHG